MLQFGIFIKIREADCGTGAADVPAVCWFVVLSLLHLNTSGRLLNICDLITQTTF